MYRVGDFRPLRRATTAPPPSPSIPGVPLIFGLRNALLLEPPSAFQHHFAKSKEEERLHMSELEYKMLRMKKKPLSVTKEATEFSDVNENEGDQNLGTLVVTKTNAGRKRMVPKDNVQFKRKKAKGPNPLSCKKKKNYAHSNDVSKKENHDGSETTSRRSRKRKRTRSRIGKKLEGTNE